MFTTISHAFLHKIELNETAVWNSTMKKPYFISKRNDAIVVMEDA